VTQAIDPTGPVAYRARAGKKEAEMSRLVGSRAAGVLLLGPWISLCVAQGAAAESAFQVKNINTTVTWSSNPTELTSVNGALFEPSTLFFAADDGVDGVELWKSDGTDTGTVLVEDIRSGPASSDPSELTRVGGAFLAAGRLYFTANDGTNGVELWKSDGTALGTQIVKNINTAVGVSSTPAKLTAVSGGSFAAGKLFFTADDGTSGVELWVSDGTAAGTVRVKDIRPGAASSSPTSLLAVGTLLFFMADNGVVGTELWKSDGTEAGTVLIKDIYAGPNSSNFQDLINVSGTVFFKAGTLAEGSELWKSDGTGPGTTMVKDINPGFASSAPYQFAAMGSTLFFQADDGVNGRELWRSDGTEAGTVLVADINPGGSAFVPTTSEGYVVVAGATLFVVADDGTHGEELWKSDGTGPGTTLVKDIFPGPTPGAVQALTNVNGTVFFPARNAPSNYELWRSDGRAEGTFQVDDISPGGDAAPYDLAVSGPFLFFSVVGPDGRELWATDLVYKDGFESGGTGVWSSANTDGGDLSVQPAAALHGTVGLSALVDDTASLFVVDESPNNEFHYRARFRLDPNGFDPGESNGKLRVRVLIAFEEDPTLRLITLVLRRIGGQYSLMGRVRLDDGTRAQTPFFNITDSQHMVEIDWTWSEGSDANNGSFTLWIDEVPVSLLTGLDTSASLVDFVRLGAMTVKPGANGTLFFDEFESRRERYIGYIP
jgi:ELWxxDGT repeat protein